MDDSRGERCSICPTCRARSLRYVESGIAWTVDNQVGEVEVSGVPVERCDACGHTAWTPEASEAVLKALAAK